MGNNKEQTSWRGSFDGPWPSAHVGGELDQAESEWLLTNDQGAYAMSTLPLMHTRRQHGILVTHLGDDFRRHVVLSHMEMTLETGGRTHQLSTHQFPNVAPTPGYRFLESFAQDPLPRWVYRLPTGTIERTVSLVRGHRAVVMGITWTGKEPARISLRPLMPMRPADTLTREHGAMMQKVTLRAGEVEVQPISDLPAVVFRHGGVFMGSPDWWRKFEYLDDRGRYVDFQEDMWSPGIFELKLVPRQTEYLVVYVGRPPEGKPDELVMEAAQHALSSDPGHHLPPEVRALSVATETFVLGDGEVIVAGYPWLDVWSRDWLLAFRGTFLARGQIERAQRSLQLLVAQLTDDFLPQRLTVPNAARTPCIDASLWLFQAVEGVLDRHEDPEFLAHMLPVLDRIFTRIESGEKTHAWLTSEGLLENAGAVPLTWMDAHVDGHGFTPRRGIAVELQALWFAATQSYARLLERAGRVERAAEARELGERTRVAFGRRLWSASTNYPFDCVSGESEQGGSWEDATIRPNGLIAAAVAPELFESWQRLEILSRVEELLLTERGLRTLDPRSAVYASHAGGTIEERRAASHQGTVWPHLLLYYVRLKLHEDPTAHELLRERVLALLVRGRALGHVAQNADAEPPHRFRGSPAYAAATAMLLEALVVDLGESASPELDDAELSARST